MLVRRPQAADTFMASSFDNDTVTAYRGFPLGVMRSDMWRYAVLYERDGLYADVDVRWERMRACVYAREGGANLKTGGVGGWSHGGR